MWKDDGTDEMKPPSRRSRSFARSGEWPVRAYLYLGSRVVGYPKICKDST